MNQSEIMNKLQQVFDQVFAQTVKISAETSAKDVPDWDSVAHISLVLSIEKAFSIRFRMGEIEKAKNIGELADIIFKKKNAV